MDNTSVVRYARRLATAGLMICSGALAATPYVPASDELVLQRIAPAGDPDERLLRAEHTALVEQPGDVDTATRYARHALDIGRARGDARLIGHAQAALATWWSQPEPPRAVWLLRATILQNQHAFDAALKDLDAMLLRDPRDAQARLLRATVLTVQAHYTEALQDCGHLFGAYGALVQASCSAGPLSLSGKAATAARLLDTLLPMSTAERADIRIWALTVAAEIAVRRGDDDDAARRYAAALQLMDAQALPDPYLLASWADFALLRGEADAVIARLQPRVDNDVLALRLAAAQQLSTPDDAPAWIAQLGERLDAAEARGDTGQTREQAWYWLHLRKDATRALSYARDNYTRQREPIDATLLMQAALAAHQAAAAQAALQWYHAHQLEDMQLAPLVARLEGSAR